MSGGTVYEDYNGGDIMLENRDLIMTTTEHTINDALAAALRGTVTRGATLSVVGSELSGMLRDSSEQPDILILEPNVSPVVCEVEVLPAISVEAEAISQLGKEVRDTGATILSSIALRLPTRIRSLQAAALLHELRIAADIDMVLYTGSHPYGHARWPHSGWVRGSVADLANLESPRQFRQRSLTGPWTSLLTASKVQQGCWRR